MIDLNKLHYGIKMDDDEAYEQLEKLVSIRNPKPVRIFFKHENEVLVCPTCWWGHDLYENHWDYCPHCGQALDWRQGDQ